MFCLVSVALAVKPEMKRVFKWTQRSAWDRVFRAILADRINETVLAEARRLNPRYISDDDFAWLSELVTVVTRQAPVDIPALLATSLSCHYEYIVAFHATKSDSAADFLTRGIRLSDTSFLERRARELFGESDVVNQAIAVLRQSGYARHNNGRVYLALTKSVCIREHSHYMLYGSEYLARIADRIGRSAELRSVGSPLIVECLIPRAALSSEFWRGRSFAMLEDYFTRVLRPAEIGQVRPSCVVVTQPIPAEHVLRVHEFTEARGPVPCEKAGTEEPRPCERRRLRLVRIWAGG